MPLTKTKPLTILRLAFSFVTVISVLAARVPAQGQTKPKQEQRTEGAPKKENDKKIVDQFQLKITEYLAKLDRNAKIATVRNDLCKIINPFEGKLRPAKGSRKYVSSDKSFVLVIAANGVSPRGESAKVSDPSARIVMAIGGNGAPRIGVNAPSNSGGWAASVAPRGVAITLGGRGGMGQGRAGGGGAGGTFSVGGIGTLCLGGSGGAGEGGAGRGGDGRGAGILKGKAIRDAFEGNRPPKPVDPKKVEELEQLARKLAAADDITPLFAQFRRALNKPVPKPTPPIQGEPAVDKLQVEIAKYLGVLNPDGEVADVREDLYEIVDPFVANLRPVKDSKTYVSSDGEFVLAIGANGVGSSGKSVSVIDPDARIVLAVGGDCKEIRPGGAATAVAPKGVAIALGGRSGPSAGGSGTNSRAGIGALCLGGKGGPASARTGRGGDGPGRGIVNGAAIVKIFHQPLDPKTVAKVKKLVSQLGSKNFQTREQATDALAKMGRSIAPLLRATLTTDDLEVRVRLFRILDRLK